MTEEKYQESAEYLTENLDFGELLAVLTNNKDPYDLAEENEDIEQDELAQHIATVEDMLEDDEVDATTYFGLEP